MSLINEIHRQGEKAGPEQHEFHQASKRCSTRSIPPFKKHPELVKAKLYERIVEGPTRTIMFRVPWIDDRGEVQVNRGFRVQFNNAIGPYKGGLRFHPSGKPGDHQVPRLRANFQEQPHHAPMGGAKGGSDFDPKGKSDMDVMRFCQAFCASSTGTSAPTWTFPPETSAWADARSAICTDTTRKLRNEHTAFSPARPWNTRQPHPSRGDRLRRDLFRGRDAHPRAVRT